MNALVKIASNQHGLEELLKKLRSNKGGVEVGFLPDSKYPDGTSVAKVVAIHEFGAPAHNIPPRPFLHTTQKAKSSQWVSKLGEALRLNNYDGKKALDVIGMIAKGDVQDAIRAVTSPALDPKTVKARSRRYKSKKCKTSVSPNKPLIDTGQLLNSVAYKVTI